MKIILFFHLLAFSPLTMDAKQFTLVIDAGHGGFDTGAIGKGKVKEKTLTLRYALAFGKMVEQNCPDLSLSISMPCLKVRGLMASRPIP